MLHPIFQEVYTKFKLHFYQEIFRRFQDREASLTAVETFCMESIMALGRPTVNEFATFMRISPPNAAYTVNSLVKKGYIRKLQSPADRQEYHLEVTQKYIDYYNISSGYMSEVMDRITARFSAEDCAIDVTGGSDAALFAAGMFAARRGVSAFTYSQKNRFYDISGAAFADELPCGLTYSIEDFFLMGGGTLLPLYKDRPNLAVGHDECVSASPLPAS